MLAPKKVKWRKPSRGRLKGKSKGGNELHLGEVGLKAITSAKLNSRQIEAARVVMIRHVKRGAKVWIRIFPDKPVTKKPAETRMGKGKGGVDHYVAVVKAGKIMFEMSGLGHEIMEEALKKASSKLPLQCIVVKKSSL